MPNKLHLAAANPDPVNGYAKVKQLIESGSVDVNQPDSEKGIRPVDFAALSGSLETLQYLIEVANADLNAEYCEENLLFFANQNPLSTVLDYATTSQVIKKFNDGTTDLHVAVYKKDVQRINRLLSASPGLVEAIDSRKETALMIAALMEHQSLVDAITTHKAFLDLNKEDKYDPMFSGQAKAAFLAGDAYHQTCQLQLAIDKFKEAICFYNKFHGKESNKFHYDLGHCYLELGFCYYNHCLDSCEELGNYFEVQIVENLRKAIFHFDTITIKTKEINQALADCYAHLGHVSLALGGCTEAIHGYKQSIIFCQQADNLLELSELSDYLERAFSQEKTSIQAEKHGFDSLDVSTDAVSDETVVVRSNRFAFFKPIILSPSNERLSPAKLSKVTFSLE